MTEATPINPIVSAHAPLSTERAAAVSEEWQRLVELCRVLRDAEALAREFLTQHVRLCGCPLCLHVATTGGW